eukprot:GEMP01055515.1.p1 GENE.GEMP01055515.1~~GEMP01055515.1.p1  ORF type:complete len:294 (+),score=57.83 GEMP01055515.1:73-954(+)
MGHTVKKFGNVLLCNAPSKAMGPAEPPQKKRKSTDISARGRQKENVDVDTEAIRRELTKAGFSRSEITEAMEATNGTSTHAALHYFIHHHSKCEKTLREGSQKSAAKTQQVQKPALKQSVKTQATKVKTNYCDVPNHVRQHALKRSEKTPATTVNTNHCEAPLDDKEDMPDVLCRLKWHNRIPTRDELRALTSSQLKNHLSRDDMLTICEHYHWEIGLLGASKSKISKEIMNIVTGRARFLVVALHELSHYLNADRLPIPKHLQNDRHETTEHAEFIASLTKLPPPRERNGVD